MHGRKAHVTGGGMHGGGLGWCAWQGGMHGRGHVWQGSMHGRGAMCGGGGACVALGACMADTTRYSDTVYERAVHILLECILVV